ncbi:hypothetical protein D8674_021643 [Pyrus ussuriensis x Pyrus communis]|uniref:Uncharacterized protein n=1 Tax=Pyrus ussuriensis x Pyrus communis TaxID=2448454 RepID=A0A5N5GHQ3_9ROSA|nr:hypothetical protein D8674_021643 [Pyrus ussuriensis x Pyrus communis]
MWFEMSIFSNLLMHFFKFGYTNIGVHVPGAGDSEDIDFYGKLTSVVQLLYKDRDGLLPSLFARVHPKLRTPIHSQIWVGIVAGILAGLFNVKILSHILSVGSLEQIKDWESRARLLEDEIRQMKSGKAEMEERLNGEIAQLKAVILERSNQMENSNKALDAMKTERYELSTKATTLQAEFIYDLDDISLEAMDYLERTLSIRYKHWKNNFHNYFKKWDNLEIARLHVPSELKDRPEDWEWLCKHFTDPKFVKKSVAGQKARESKILLHHSGSKPFSYRLEERRQEGSKFPEIDMFKDVYVRPGNETAEQFYSTAVLQEAASQLPPETSIEEVMVPEDVGFQIMTEVLDQNLGRRHEHMREQMRAQGEQMMEQMRAQSDQMREQMRAQDDQMKAQLRAQNEEVRTYAETVRDLVRAIQTAGLQVSLPVPHLDPPSTSAPLHPPDTQ